jgi:hypothetical protein
LKKLHEEETSSITNPYPDKKSFLTSGATPCRSWAVSFRAGLPDVGRTL